MLYFDNGPVQLYWSDARRLPLPDQSVHCVVTSPPYYGLRVYQGLGDQGIGLEASIDEYVATLLDVFREVRRVLRDDGVLWINLGDSYCDDSKWGGSTGGKHVAALHGKTGIGRTKRKANDSAGAKQMSNPGSVDAPGRGASGLAGGNRLGVPERVVLALQGDGWCWRDTVIWAKKSAMPESVNGWRWEQCRVKVRGTGWGGDDGSIHPSQRLDGLTMARANSGGIPTDGVAKYESCPGCPKCADNDGLVLRKGSWRCTSAHEYIFMLTKGMGYYADAEAVRELQTGDTHSRGHGDSPKGQSADQGARANSSFHIATSVLVDVGGRNRRSVWNDISPEPYGGPHFAVFPSDLPRICIQASTSERGCCPECGSQWARVIQRTDEPDPSYKGSSFSDGKTGDRDGGDRTQEGDQFLSATLGWRATCTCDAGEPVPAMVLDPFAGTATTCLAAQRLGRHAVGVDLSDIYLRQAIKRLEE